MQLRLVDCQDSFSWNLVDLFQGLGADVEVLSIGASHADFSVPGPAAWVLSPGPGRPSDWPKLFQILNNLAPDTPLLGVCLGHQAVGEYFGARLRRVVPLHGESVRIRKLSGRLLGGLNDGFEAMRYNSLGLEPYSKPECLRWTALGPGGEPMALEHRWRPWFGVQFHPDSILTPDGRQIAARFLEIAQ